MAAPLRDRNRRKRLIQSLFQGFFPCVVHRVLRIMYTRGDWNPEKFGPPTMAARTHGSIEEMRVYAFSIGSMIFWKASNEVSPRTSWPLMKNDGVEFTLSLSTAQS